GNSEGPRVFQGPRQGTSQASPRACLRSAAAGLSPARYREEERKERHTSPAASQTDLERIRIPLSGSHFLLRAWLAQCIAASQHLFDVILAARCVGEFPSQLADKHVDDLGLRLIHAAIEMVQETFFGERRVLAQCKELQDFVFLSGQMHTRAPDLDAL